MENASMLPTKEQQKVKVEVNEAEEKKIRPEKDLIKFERIPKTQKKIQRHCQNYSNY